MYVNTQPTIGIIGLGYVGLPLAVEIGRKYPAVGFDINSRRIDEFRALVAPGGVVFDVKGVFDKDLADGRL